MAQTFRRVFCQRFRFIVLFVLSTHRYYENHPNMQDKAVMLYHKVLFKVFYPSRERSTTHGLLII